MGPQVLKNIAEPMRVWRVRIGPSFSPAMLTRPPTETALPLALPDKPSIAVLPFQNMSGDPEQEYFRRRHGRGHHYRTVANQIAFVIARTPPSHTEAKPSISSRSAGELGVRYVLEGSVRKLAIAFASRTAH